MCAFVYACWKFMLGKRSRLLKCRPGFQERTEEMVVMIKERSWILLTSASCENGSGWMVNGMKKGK